MICFMGYMVSQNQFVLWKITKSVFFYCLECGVDWPINSLWNHIEPNNIACATNTGSPKKTNWSITAQCSKEMLWVIRTKGSGTSYSKDHFNGSKYLEQLSVHSCKRKKKEKIWQNSSHLEFHSIFNQDGITNSPKICSFKGQKG